MGGVPFAGRAARIPIRQRCRLSSGCVFCSLAFTALALLLSRQWHNLLLFAFHGCRCHTFRLSEQTPCAISASPHTSTKSRSAYSGSGGHSTSGAMGGQTTRCGGSNSGCLDVHPPTAKNSSRVKLRNLRNFGIAIPLQGDTLGDSTCRSASPGSGCSVSSASRNLVRFRHRSTSRRSSDSVFRA